MPWVIWVCPPTTTLSPNSLHYSLLYTCFSNVPGTSPFEGSIHTLTPCETPLTLTLYYAAVSSSILCAFYDPYFPLFFPINLSYLIYYIFVCFCSLASPPKWRLSMKVRTVHCYPQYKGQYLAQSSEITNICYMKGKNEYQKRGSINRFLLLI